MADDLPPPAPMACIGSDPTCPCQDGAVCHYRDAADGTKGWPIPVPPLPEPDAIVSRDDGIDRAMWAGESMAAYARAAVEAQRAEIGRLQHQANNDICEIERLREMYLKWRGLAVLALHRWEAGEDLQGVVDTIDQERIHERSKTDDRSRG
jgi:hypothetical protein